MTKPYIIGVTGGSGCGKTTFLQKLGAIFAKEQVCIVSQDNYYFARHEQVTDKQGYSNFDLPTAIDTTVFIEHLRELIAGKCVKLVEYVYNNEKSKSESTLICSAPVIIVEGIFIFYIKEIFDLIDLKIFIHAKEEQKIIRRIKRDLSERNYSLEEVMYRYEHHVLPAYEQYTKPYMGNADIIINNDGGFQKSLEVIKAFIQKKINIASSKE